MIDPTFKPGDLVIDNRGVLRSVVFQANDVQVFVGCNTWVHPTKIRLARPAATAKRPPPADASL